MFSNHAPFTLLKIIKNLFLQVAATELISKYIGSPAANVRNLFATARKYAPAIIFIDEVDAITKKRADTADINDEVNA